jgi:hypothetical protein
MFTGDPPNVHSCDGEDRAISGKPANFRALREGTRPKQELPGARKCYDRTKAMAFGGFAGNRKLLILRELIGAAFGPRFATKRV